MYIERKILLQIKPSIQLTDKHTLSTTTISNLGRRRQARPPTPPHSPCPAWPCTASLITPIEHSTFTQASQDTFPTSKHSVAINSAL
ncbi:hypothetical protein E2C01_021972 [Portunus trituberculatus]|uniref:Uncharacterized protein n=1 Tax=Portunus trituberculatus TaxID=210409 RepID=A0A5B7E405_PORTR|nr:hypothetical protein [Portunus trituberculatus]